MTKKRTKDEIVEIVENCGYILLEHYTKNGKTKVIIQDSYGYRYDVDFSSFIKNFEKISKINNRNPYSLYNISIWLTINEKTFLLVCKEYKNNFTPLEFKCLICNEYFFMSWNSVSAGRGCGICVGQQVGKYSNLEYLYPNLAKEWHPNNKKKPNEVTCGSGERVFWICSTCHYEWKASINHRTRPRNRGCPSCSGNVVSDKNRLSILYPEISLEWHPTKNGNKTPYNVSYGSEKKFWWLCPVEHEYISSISNRTRRKSGCPKCKLSKGEARVSKFLYESNIKYSTGYKFDGCRNILLLPFDFYLPDYNLCIEYHGKQHYEPIKIFGGAKQLRQQQKLDKIKEDYCRNNNINLLIIPYGDFNNINEILEKTLL